MAGRVRHLEMDEFVRHRVLGMTRDSLGVDSSRELRESHTAPSGLPATRSGDAYSTLGRVEFGELQRKMGKKSRKRPKGQWTRTVKRVLVLIYRNSFHVSEQLE